jgi:hypothetical protein
MAAEQNDQAASNGEMLENDFSLGADVGDAGFRSGPPQSGIMIPPELFEKICFVTS